MLKKNRLARVIANMQAQDFTQIIITSVPSIYYLTEHWIEPHERLLALYVHVDGTVVLCGNQLYDITPEACDFECLLHSDTQDPIADLAKVVRAGKIGIDKLWSANYLLMLLAARADLQPVIGSAPVDDARMLKDAEEIAQMRHASKINDQAMATVISSIRAGVTETQLAGVLQESFLSQGADFPVGTQLVCFGANAADPHHEPSNAVIQAGDCALFDIFTPVNRYWCDMTRTVYVNAVSAEQETIYELVRQANAAAIAAIKPGVPLAQIDAAARNIIADAGYGEKFIHRLGHGCGMDCHEPPNCNSVSEAIATPGMIFSVEPGIYLEGKHGVRIEDLVLVTETGCEVLNAYPKTLQVVTI